MSFTIAPHIQGLIFDADGTLVDTMALHYLAWRETMQVLGADFPEKLFYDLAGVPSDKIIETLNQNFGYQLNPKQTAARKETLFMKSYLPRAQPIEPVVAINPTNTAASSAVRPIRAINVSNTYTNAMPQIMLLAAYTVSTGQPNQGSAPNCHNRWCKNTVRGACQLYTTRKSKSG